jgi:hypothetical protein
MVSTAPNQLGIIALYQLLSEHTYVCSGRESVRMRDVDSIIHRRRTLSPSDTLFLFYTLLIVNTPLVNVSRVFGQLGATYTGFAPKVHEPFLQASNHRFYVNRPCESENSLRILEDISIMTVRAMSKATIRAWFAILYALEVDGQTAFGVAQEDTVM